MGFGPDPAKIQPCPGAAPPVGLRPPDPNVSHPLSGSRLPIQEDFPAPLPGEGFGQGEGVRAVALPSSVQPGEPLCRSQPRAGSPCPALPVLWFGYGDTRGTRVALGVVAVGRCCACRVPERGFPCAQSDGGTARLLGVWEAGREGGMQAACPAFPFPREKVPGPGCSVLDALLDLMLDLMPRSPPCSPGVPVPPFPLQWACGAVTGAFAGLWRWRLHLPEAAAATSASPRGLPRLCRAHTERGLRFPRSSSPERWVAPGAMPHGPGAPGVYGTQHRTGEEGVQPPTRGGPWWGLRPSSGTGCGDAAPGGPSPSPITAEDPLDPFLPLGARGGEHCISSTRLCVCLLLPPR